jgi:hypothetical protein
MDHRKSKMKVSVREEVGKVEALKIKEARKK